MPANYTAGRQSRGQAADPFEDEVKNAHWLAPHPA
jgi:hypothetical protein